MKRLIESITGHYASSASVVDGTLVLSLPDAITPTVWRLELVHVKASALEVRPQDDGSFVLVLKTPRGDVNQIAAYETKGRAVTALMAVTRAMENAHGQFGPVHAANASTHDYNPAQLPVVPPRKHKRPSGGKNWAGAVAAVIAIIILSAVLLSMTPQPMTSLSNTNPAAGTSATAGAPVTNGVAVSADEFLKNQ